MTTGEEQLRYDERTEVRLDQIEAVLAERASRGHKPTMYYASEQHLLAALFVYYGGSQQGRREH